MNWPQILATIRARIGGAGADHMASKSAFLYNPPKVPRRPFELDYPQGAITDEAGNLRFDIDGRPIGRGFVVGRAQAGGSDTRLPESAYDAITAELTGQGPAVVTPRELSSRGILGEVVTNRYSRKPELVRLSGLLTPQQLPNVYAHELGHVIDQAAGEIPTRGLNKELSHIYNDTNNPNLAQRRSLLGADDIDISKSVNLRNWTPKSAGYAGTDDASREQMAEAVRAYMANPNYMKSVAPKAAERIRSHVNGNPWLRDIIQFNTFAPASAALGLMAFGNSDAWAAPATGEAKADEYPGLETAADLLDKYIRTPIPLMQEPLGGTSNWLRNFGRDRPWQDRLGDAYGAAFDWLR